MQALGSDSALLAGATVSGVRALLVAPFAMSGPTAPYTYADASCQRLTSLGPLAGWRAAMLPGPAPGAGPGATAGEDGALSVRGWGFGQGIVLSGPGLSEGRRAVLEALRLGGPVVALWQDGSGHWWLYGQERGLRLSTSKAQADSAGLALTLASTQPTPARAVADGVALELLDYTPPTPPGSGTVELRTSGGRLLAVAQAGQKIILHSGFKLGYQIV